MCMFCRSFFVLLTFLFWPLCCRFSFDLRILITPLVSSNWTLLNDITSILEEYIILDLTWQTCDEKMHVYLPTWNVQITIRQMCNSPIYKILTTIHVNVQFYVWYRKLVRIKVGENWMGNQEWTIETPTTLGTRHRIRQTKQQQQTLTTPAVLHI